MAEQRFMPVYEGSEQIGMTPKGRPGTTIGGMFVSPGTRLSRPPVAPRPVTVTPETALQKQFMMGQQQIQDKYAMQWEEVNRSARFLGPAKHREMLQKIDMAAKQEMLAFNQKAQATLVPLQQLDEMAKQGLIPNVDQIKARMVFGQDIAASMYPERPSVEKQYGALDIHANRIEGRMKEFVIGKGKPGVGKRIIAGAFALAGSPYYHILKIQKEIEKEGLQIKDYTDPDYTYVLRSATENEILEYAGLLAEKQDIDRRRREILGQRDVTQRTVQPGTTGGSFADKVAESIKPTAAELRKQGTRQAYEKGKELGYWQ